MKNLQLIIILFLAAVNISYSQWVICPSSAPGLGNFPTISVPDCSTIILAGGLTNNPRVFRSTNSGVNFVNITGNITGSELYCVWAKSADTIFAGDGGPNAKIWKTVNGGVNWSVVLTTGGTAGFINGIRFLRPEQKYGVIMSDAPTGSNPLMYKTSDGGQTWITQTVTSNGGATGSVATVFIADSMFYGFGHSNTSRVSMTTNGGVNWGFLNITLTGNSTYGIDCGPRGDCFVASYNSLPTIVKFTSSSRAIEYINIGPGLTGFPYFSWVYGTENVYIAGTTGPNGCVKKSTNTGTNWSQMTTASIQGIIGVDLHYNGGTDVCAYALAQDGTVLKLNDQVIGIQPVNSHVPKNYLLEQNYPNPFNPATNVKYSIPKSGYVTIKIYNTLGGLVSTLVNEHHAAGNYSVDFNSEGLSSGIYYYRISAGEFTDTKKMVLVK
jgi:photosystem II stability/assembly factor-like uncharacterized protein